MNHERMDETIKENRMKAMDGGRKKDSLPALTASCYLALWSPCHQRYPKETQSSLQSRKKQQQLKLSFLSKTFPEDEFNLAVREK